MRRFPTLVSAADVAGSPVLIFEYPWYLCSAASGGGGSSKLGNVEAFGLRAAKLAGALMGSVPACMEGGYATAAATIAVVLVNVKNSLLFLGNNSQARYR